MAQISGNRSEHETLWQTASRLLELERIVTGSVQEISGNYDSVTHACPMFADFGRGEMRALGVAFEASRVEAAVRLLAASQGAVVELEEPFVNLVLPNGARFSACLPPASDGPTFSIRTQWRAVRPLVDFMSAPWQLARVEEAIRRGDNIVVAGSTNTGKTTFVNALAARLIEFAPNERLGIIEDEPELKIEARNAIRRLARGRADMRRHVREMLRLRPDRIVIGEVRGPEALDLLKAWSTGHSGGFTTIHANSAKAAVLRLESLVEEAGVPPQARLIADTVNLILFLRRKPDGARRVAEMIRLEGYSTASGYSMRELTEKDQ